MTNIKDDIYITFATREPFKTITREPFKLCDNCKGSGFITVLQPDGLYKFVDCFCVVYKLSSDKSSYQDVTKEGC